MSRRAAAVVVGLGLVTAMVAGCYEDPWLTDARSDLCKSTRSAAAEAFSVGVDTDAIKAGDTAEAPAGLITSGPLSVALITPEEPRAALAASLRQGLVEQMHRQLEARLASALQIHCTPCIDPPSFWDSRGRVAYDSAAQGSSYNSMPSASAGGSSSAPPAASDYSTTNNQVAGVEEADLVKNDGSTMYVVAQGSLQIIGAWPADEAALLASLPIEGEPKKLFLHGDLAVVYSSLEPLASVPPYGYRGDCTHGWDCEFTGDGHATKITLVDVGERTQPTVLRELRFNGSLLSARRIDDVVHTVLYFPSGVVPPVYKTWPDGVQSHLPYCDEGAKWHSPEVLRAEFDKLRVHNEALIAAVSDDELLSFMPEAADSLVDDGPTDLLGDGSTLRISEAGGAGILSLVSIDVTAAEPLSHSEVVGQPGAVYASAGALYVAQRQRPGSTHGWYYPWNDGIREATAVHKFDLEPGSVEVSYAGSGVVQGRVLNQFSLDELDGYLRVATTTGRAPSPQAKSTMSVLAERDGELELVGELDGLAPSEDIRSVRFNGDVGYIVTFKKTDPLFVIDLVDPEAPRVAGELKIPGFSTYMHMLDDSHIMSIGYDSEDHGTFAYFQGIMLQIFDVASLSDPKLVHKTIIGTRGSSSEAALDHLAFNWFESRQLLAIPLVVCEDSSGGGSYGSELTFNGLEVFRVSLDDGFEDLGGIPHEQTEQNLCHSWWTQSTTSVKRSVFMEDFVYSVSDSLVQVSHIDDLARPVASVPLQLFDAE